MTHVVYIVGPTLLANPISTYVPRMTEFLSSYRLKYHPLFIDFTWGTEVNKALAKSLVQNAWSFLNNQPCITLMKNFE